MSETKEIGDYAFESNGGIDINDKKVRSHNNDTPIFLENLKYKIEPKAENIYVQLSKKDKITFLNEFNKQILNELDHYGMFKIELRDLNTFLDNYNISQNIEKIQEEDLVIVDAAPLIDNRVSDGMQYEKEQKHVFTGNNGNPFYAAFKALKYLTNKK